jgi:hypothetical protein
MKTIFAILFGVGVGISGAFLHNGYRPFGVVVSLFAIWLGARLVRKMYRSQLSNFLYATGWVAVIIRGSTLGNGGEILIEANVYGNLLVFGGAAILVVGLLRKQN